jgi:hypothetical protein
MKYGDFASIVQLGVGLHLGTALLQLYGEFGVQPLIRTLSRARSLVGTAPNSDERSLVSEALDELEGRFEIFKIQLFNEYRKYIAVNAYISFVLVAILVFISYASNLEVSIGWVWITILMTALSIIPGPVTLYCLWTDAAKQLRPMKNEATHVESRALRLHGGKASS